MDVLTENPAVAFNEDSTDQKLPDLQKIIDAHIAGDTKFAKWAYEKLISSGQYDEIVCSNLAVIYTQEQNHSKALELLREAARIEPAYVEAYLKIGCILEQKGLGQLDEIIALYQKVLKLKPDYAQAHFALGSALHRLGKTDEAVDCYRKAVFYLPDHIVSNYNLANLLMIQNHLDEAIQYFKKVLELDETMGGALGKLWLLRMQMCDWSDYKTQFNGLKERIQKSQVPTRRPDVVNTVTPFSMLGLFDDPELLHSTAKQYAAALTSTVEDVPPLFLSHQKQVRDVIKIAFFATDLHDHPTTFLIAELFELLDRTQFEIHAVIYNRVNKPSVMRSRIMSICEHFHDVTEGTDKEIAHFMADLGFDIIVDLKGLTEGCRPGILAYRPAPIQVRLLGFPGTTGADFIDYLIADPVIIPKEEQSHYSESIMYMPDTYQINDRKRAVHPETPTRAECGLPEDAFVYCSFNNNFKITPDLFDIWMEILQETPGSVLWVLESNHWSNENLKKEAELRGIDPERLIIAEQLPADHHLARIKNADLFLDSFPCNAHTTASDALWVGLPVLTCIGRSFAARVAASVLKAADLEELISTDFKSYKSLALELAHNPEKLNQIKSKLINNRDTCSLFDTETYTKYLERGFQHMMDLHKEGLKAETFHVSDLKDGNPKTEIDPAPENNSLIINIAIISPQDHVHSDTYKTATETLSKSLKELGFITNVAENTLIDDGINIILGAHLLEDNDIKLLPGSSIIYNLEVITDTSTWLTPALMNLFNTFEVWDASETNIDALYTKGISKMICFVPCENSKTQNVVEYINEAFMALGNNTKMQSQTTLTNDSQPTSTKDPVEKVTATAVVCVPIYNEEKYIEDTLNSLHNVPVDLDVKFFISDNNSTDQTFEIVKSFAAKDERFIIHQHDNNLGAAENFNYVYNNSDSHYVMWLGGHDQIDPEYIRKAIDTFDKHEDAAYVAAEPNGFFDDIKNSVLMEDAKYDFSEHRLTRYMQSVGALANCTIVNSMFRRKFMNDLEFRTTIGNDHVWISHLLWYGKIYYTEKEKYYRRFFKKDRESQEKRLTGDITERLEYFSLIEYYIDDFKKLYNQPGEMQDYLCQKMLTILEQRFGLEAFYRSEQIVSQQAKLSNKNNLDDSQAKIKPKETETGMIIFTGTGRSGTGLYSKLFNTHHEYQVPELIKHFVSDNLETDPFSDFDTRLQIMKEHLKGVNYDSFRDSSNPYIHFLDALYTLNNDIKIIFGVRDGRDFVRSSLIRGYYDDKKYSGFSQRPIKGDAYHEEWSEMSPIERCAWLWVYRNQKALDRLEPVPENNKYLFRLEDINNDKKLEGLENFLGFKADKKWVDIKVNANKQVDFPNKSEWTDEMNFQFYRIAGDMMKKLGYPLIKEPIQS